MSDKWLAAVLDDGGEGDAAPVGGGVFVVSGGDSAPLFESAEAAFDDVAISVSLTRKVWWPSAAAASVFSVLDLIGSFGDGAADPPPSQIPPCRRVGIGLVSKEMERF